VEYQPNTSFPKVFPNNFINLKIGGAKNNPYYYKIEKQLISTKVRAKY
jgi:hypothetical protein